MKRAGAETMIMQYLRQMVGDDRFEFSILVHGYDKGDYDDEIRSLNVPLYHVPIRGEHPLIYTYKVENIFKTHPVEIVHCNMDSACGYFLSIAKKCGVKHRIAHSHTTKYQAKRGVKKIIGVYSKSKIHSVATMRLACSQKAGKWLFDEDEFEIINNAIDLKLYWPREDLRLKKRKELGIPSNAFVIGHVGRFCYEKNHEFLLQAFAKMKIERQNSKLLLIGVGALMEKIKEYAVELDVAKDVMFLGLRDDVPELMQLMDCFAMPSLFEGLPVSGIEAQATGLPCLFSDTITSEICMTDYAKQISIDDIDLWADNLKKMPIKNNVAQAQEALKIRGYDIVTESMKLINIYNEMIN